MVSLLAGFLLFARPASYTAVTRVAADPQALPRVFAADRLARVATRVEASAAFERHLAARPDAPALRARLQESLRARPHEVAGWIEIEFSHADPTIAAMVTHEIARSLGTARDRDPLTLGPLEDAERALRAQEARLGPEEPEARLAAQQEDLGALQDRISVLDASVAALRTQLDALARDDLESIADRRGIVRGRQQLDRAMLELAALVDRYGPRHQRRIAAAGAVDAARRLLSDEVQVARDQLRARMRAALEERDALRTELDALETRSAELGDQLVELARLRLELQQARRRYEGADDSLPEISEAPVPLEADLPDELPWLPALFLGVFAASMLLQRART